MATVSFSSSTSPTSLSLNSTLENGKNCRDASFSSYLNSAEESYVLKISASNRNLSPIVSIPRDHHLSESNKADEGEIDVFAAEKYFNEAALEEGIHENAPKSHMKKDTINGFHSPRPKSKPGTPSIRSESSWNSRSALLHPLPKNQYSAKASRAPGRSFLASLGCNCPCTDKNSLDIDDNFGETSSIKSFSSRSANGKIKHPKRPGNPPGVKGSSPETWSKQSIHCKKLEEPRIRLNTEERFSFPAFNQGKAGNPVIKVQLEGEQDDATRKSLEVFGSPIMEKPGKGSFDQRVEMLTSWDAIPPRVEEIKIPPASTRTYNDTDSDASSDLFEIESFSTTANSFYARQASDGMSSCVTPTTCYAPSEVSIEWSVVTASAADFSMMSDSEEHRTSTSINNHHPFFQNGKNGVDKEMAKKRSSILSGCKSQKAVRVARDAYRINDKPIPDPRRQIRPESMSMTRFNAESKMASYGSRNAQHSFDAHARGAANLLYIQ